MSLKGQIPNITLPFHKKSYGINPSYFPRETKGAFRLKKYLHIRIIRSAAAFGYSPINILCRVFDVAGFAVDAILAVDPEEFFTVFLDDFVNGGRAIALRRFGIIGEVPFDWNGRIF